MAGTNGRDKWPVVINALVEASREARKHRLAGTGALERQPIGQPGNPRETSHSNVTYGQAPGRNGSGNQLGAMPRRLQSTDNRHIR